MLRAMFLRYYEFSKEQYVRVTEGGDRVDVENHVNWKSPNSLLKVSFPLTANNPNATYDLGLGTIDRASNEPDKYEVPAQKWAGITDTSGAQAPRRSRIAKR